MPWNIIGHKPALAVLDKALQSDWPPHAWLFAGPEGVGKRAVAIEFAAALNCSENDKPCGQCRIGFETRQERHADVEVVQPGGICDEAEHRDHADSREVRICQIRRLQRILSLSSYAGGRRVAIVDGADTMRAEAANAFLKTLEEPPAGVVIVLLVEREERLPETVLSRCQKVSFRPLQRDLIRNELLARGAAREEAETIAAAACGRIGWALQALQDKGLLQERAGMLDDAARLARADRAERFAWARAAEGRGIDARERYLRELQVWETWWRDVLLVCSGGSDGLINSDCAAQLALEGKMYKEADIVAFLKALLQTREYLQANVDPQLALENLMLDLPSPQAAP